MRIAMIGQKGIPAQSGGIEQHVAMLSTLLSERGHEVLVYCRDSYCRASDSDDKGDDGGGGSKTGSGGWVQRIFRPSIATKHLDAITHTLSSTCDVLFRRVDVVHYHAIGPAALAPVARSFHLPTVVTCHGLDWQRAKWGRIAKRCLRLGEWSAARFASRLVVVSEPLREYFAKEHGVDAVYIPNAVVPMVRRVPDRIRKWDLRPGNYLLAASRLVPEKGLHYLIAAFQDVQTDLKLVIAGGGGLDSTYEQNLRSTRDPRIVFVGDADRELMSELYSNALLFVLPSEIEGMSIALLEAMSCGLPVLVSDIPENACVVGEDGFTFQARSIPHLRTVLDSLVDNFTLLGEFGERCRSRAARFQWPAVVDQLEAVYRDVSHPTDTPGNERGSTIWPGITRREPNATAEIAFGSNQAEAGTVPQGSVLAK